MANDHALAIAMEIQKRNRKKRMGAVAPAPLSEVLHDEIDVTEMPDIDLMDDFEDEAIPTLPEDEPTPNRLETVMNRLKQSRMRPKKPTLDT